MGTNKERVEDQSTQKLIDDFQTVKNDRNKLYLDFIFMLYSSKNIIRYYSACL